MTTIRTFLYTAAATLALSSGALAASNDIAVVNIQQIMNESTAAKSAHEQLENKYKTFRADLSKKQDQLQKEEQELGKQQSVLSKSAFEEKVRAFRKKETDAQKEVQSRKALLDNASARAGMEIQKAVMEIVADLAKEKGFVLAISAESPTSQILYADAKLDISNDVLTRLNAKLPKLDVKFDAPEAKKDSKTDKK